MFKKLFLRFLFMILVDPFLILVYNIELLSASEEGELTGEVVLLAVVMSNGDAEDGLTVLEATVGKDGGGIAHTGARGDALDMEIGREVQVLVSRQLTDQGLDVVEVMAGAVHDLEDHLTLFAGMDNALLALVDDAHIAQLDGGACTLQVVDRHALLARHGARRLLRRSYRQSGALLVGRSGDAEVYAVVTAIGAVVAGVVRGRGGGSTVTTATDITLTTVLVVALRFALVGSRTDGSTNGGTTRHAYDGSGITAAPATGESTDGGAKDGAKLGTDKGTLTSICATAGEQQGEQG